MLTRPLLLDLFCGAGGAARGYALADFDVVGVDVQPQPNYPYAFYQADALAVLHYDGWLRQFDAIHASPPCQAYSTQTARRDLHARLIAPVREALVRAGLPYVMENVEGSTRTPAPDPLLRVELRLGPPPPSLLRDELACRSACLRPRLAGAPLPFSRLRMTVAGRLAKVVGVHGHLNHQGEFALRCRAIGIDWMTNGELVNAVPPAYTAHLDRQLLAVVHTVAA